MDFNTYHTQAWSDHTRDAKKVAKTFLTGIQLIAEPVQIIQFSQLLTHVMGEHLGKWAEGIRLLQNLLTLEGAKANQDCYEAIQRSIAILKICDDSKNSLSLFSNSEQIRILSTAASAMAAHQNTAKAQAFLKKAVDLANLGLAKEDPANRALAIAGNNLASTLEERKAPSKDEYDLMIFAAITGRKFWEVAGTWLEIERAEYRLAQSHMKAKNLAPARLHAGLCLEICKKNQAPALEMFFAYEVLALIEKAAGQKKEFDAAISEMKKQFVNLSVDEKTWCDDTLKKLLA